MIIYKAENIINKKIYIGQTIHTLKYRRSQHIAKRKILDVTNYFHNSIRKYGINNFEWSIIDTATSMDELNLKEIQWIKHYKSSQRKFGYNATFGGKNAIPNDDTRKKISKSRKGKCVLKNHPAWRHDIDERKVVEFRQSGMGLDKIAKKMNCSRRTIETHLMLVLGKESITKDYLRTLRIDNTKQQYVRPFVSGVSDEQIIQLYNEGVIIVKIAEQLQISERQIYKRLKMCNVPKRHKWK